MTNATAKLIEVDKKHVAAEEALSRSPGLRALKYLTDWHEELFLSLSTIFYGLWFFLPGDTTTISPSFSFFRKVPFFSHDNNLGIIYVIIGFLLWLVTCVKSRKFASICLFTHACLWGMTTGLFLRGSFFSTTGPVAFCMTVAALYTLVFNFRKYPGPLEKSP